jgi:hypothetical protein
MARDDSIDRSRASHGAHALNDASRVRGAAGEDHRNDDERCERDRDDRRAQCRTCRQVNDESELSGRHSRIRLAAQNSAARMIVKRKATRE